MDEAPATTAEAQAGAALSALAAWSSALLGLARLEVRRALRGVILAVLLVLAAAVLLGAFVLLGVVLLLLVLHAATHSWLLAVVLALPLLLIAALLVLRAARRAVRPLTLPATRAELAALTSCVAPAAAAAEHEHDATR